MNKTIYLIRHGETNFNVEGKLQGSRIDTNLNETGQKQTKAFFDKYATIPFDKIYTSPYKRSIQTVQPFIDINVPFETHRGLNEIDWGVKDGTVCIDTDDKSYLRVIEQWNNGNLTVRMEEGENPLEVQVRQKEFLNMMLQHHKEMNVLICMHGRAIRILLSTITETPLAEMAKFKHNNTGLYIINYSKGFFSIVAHNDLSHLKK